MKSIVKSIIKKLQKVKKTKSKTKTKKIKKNKNSQKMRNVTRNKNTQRKSITKTKKKSSKTSVLASNFKNMYQIFKSTKSVKDYDTYIIFFCSDLNNHIKRIETLLDIKIPSNLKNEINNIEEDFVDFYLGDKNFIFSNFKNKSSCKEKNCHENASIIGKRINNTKKKYLVIIDNNQYLSLLISGIIQGYYKFTKYNSTNIDMPSIDFYYDDHFEKLKDSQAIEKAIKININQCEVRDLINEPVNLLNSITYLNHIRKSLAPYKNIKINVLNKEQLKKMGMNLILAVNKGSVNPPMLITLEYINSNNKDDKNICLVGKGVMFDTGGINIKYDQFYDMKSDMAGSAIVYGVIKTLADLGIKKNVIGILPIVENDVDGKATHPGDIVKSYSGKTVEILDTDAEGRLILADAIYYCKKYNPKIIIDIATLTGQVAEIFDSIATGIMSNDTKVIETFKRIGQIENEKIWDLPMWDEYVEDTESTIADIKNINRGDASTINGAAFLINFLPTPKTKWAHLDIAGVSYNLEDTDTKYEGATGESLRTLINYVTHN